MNIFGASSPFILKSFEITQIIAQGVVFITAHYITMGRWSMSYMRLAMITAALLIQV